MGSETKYIPYDNLRSTDPIRQQSLNFKDSIKKKKKKKKKKIKSKVVINNME